MSISVKHRALHIQRQFADVQRFRGEYSAAGRRARKTAAKYKTLYSEAPAAWCALIAIDAERAQLDHNTKHDQLLNDYAGLEAICRYQGWTGLADRCHSRVLDILITKGTSISGNISDIQLQSKVRCGLLAGRSNILKRKYADAVACFEFAKKANKECPRHSKISENVADFGLAECVRLSSKSPKSDLSNIKAYERLLVNATGRGFTWLAVRCAAAIRLRGGTSDYTPPIRLEGLDKSVYERFIASNNPPSKETLFDCLFF